LPIVWIPEQEIVAAVRDHVINNVRRPNLVAVTTVRIVADRVSGEERRTFAAPP
jgi:hypothetical protein